jgi:hypothetical protein
MLLQILFRQPFFPSLLFSLVVCLAQSAASQTGGPGRAGDWVSGSGQGYTEYQTKSGRSYISIGCDVGATLDHSGTGISLEIDGKLLPPNSAVTFDVDGQRITIPTGASGGVHTRECEECAHKFYELWPLLRKGRRLQVTSSDGRQVDFSLRGTSQLLPATPCKTAFQMSTNNSSSDRSALPSDVPQRENSGDDTKVTENASPATNTGLASAKARRFVDQFVAGANMPPVAPTDIEIQLVDLNDDGSEEAFVIITSLYFCGSAGCSAFILDLSRPEAHSMGEFLAVGFSVLPGTTGGWRDVQMNNHARLVYENGRYIVARSKVETLLNKPSDASWKVYGHVGEGMLGARATASDGATILNIGCNRLLGPTLAGSIHGYSGNGLTRIDDNAETLVFEFVNSKGKHSRFEGRVNYFAPDGAWAVRDYPAHMLEPFASGTRLKLRNRSGLIIAEFSLTGSTPVTAAMRKACGF